MVNLGVDREAEAAANSARHVFATLNPNMVFPEPHPIPPELEALKKKQAAARRTEMEASPAAAAIWLWIRQAGLVRAWGSLEALAEDMWIDALNNGGRKLCTEALREVAKSTEEGSGIGKKHVEIGLLAQHDFDLRGKIGSILAPRCKFKTVTGIGRAYKAAFGWTDEHPCPAFADPPTLERIEAKRHLIVHRGGWIDREYARKASLGDEMLGAPLQLGADQAVEDINQVLIEGAKLIATTAQWLDAMEPLQSPLDDDKI